MKLLHFNHLQQFAEIQHFITTRNNGVSHPPFDSLNLGLHVGDDYEKVIQNRSFLAENLSIELQNFCIPQQIHSNKVAVVTALDAGKGSMHYDTAIPEVDGLITAEKNICVMVFAADCALLLFYDVVQKVIAATHAGWRGAVGQIAQNTILAMQEKFASKSENILIGISPCIALEDYEVGEEVENSVFEAYGTIDKYLQINPLTHKKHFDLRYTLLQQLLKVGVLAKNIEINPISTFSHSHTFFSSRKDNGKTGRFGAGIMLKS